MKYTAKLLSGLVLAGFVLALQPASAQAGRYQNPGNCYFMPNFSTAAPTQALTDGEKAALDVAIQDEYKSRATYNKILETFGDVRPFSNIVHAEGRHVEMLAQLHERYGLPVPEDAWADKVPEYETLLEAAEASVQGEMENGALYDTLMAEVTNPELRAVFNALRFATMEHHLPAFQRLVDRQMGLRPGYGQGWGRGQGFGRGYGAGPGMGRGQGFGRGYGAGPGTGRGRGPGRGLGYGPGPRW